LFVHFCVKVNILKLIFINLIKATFAKSCILLFWLQSLP
jgi:hypothetical protein